MSMQKTHVTLDEFERISAQPGNRARRLEIINGEIVETMPTEERGVTAGIIFALIWNVIHANP